MCEFRSAFRSALLSIACVIAVSCGPGEQPQNVTAQQDTGVADTTIRAQLSANFAAGNKRDADGVIATYAPDGDVMIGDGPRVVGRDAIRELLVAAWATAPSDRQGSLAVDAIRFLGPDIAIVESTTRWAAGDPLQDRATWIMVRRDGTWKIAALRVLPAQQ